MFAIIMYDNDYMNNQRDDERRAPICCEIAAAIFNLTVDFVRTRTLRVRFQQLLKIRRQQNFIP